MTHSKRYLRLIWILVLGLLSLSLHSCRTGCGCPMAEAETERGFQATPKSSSTFPSNEVSSHRIQPDFIIVVVKETVFTQVVS